MPTIDPSATYATFTNVFKCQPQHQDAVARINIEIIERVASRTPGFISASVHRSDDGTRVFNYLQRQTPEHPAAMQASPEFREIAARLAGLIELNPTNAK